MLAIDCKWCHFDKNTLTIFLEQIKEYRTTLIYTGQEPLANDLLAAATMMNISIIKEPTKEGEVAVISPNAANRLGFKPSY
jgi:glutaredoxin